MTTTFQDTIVAPLVQSDVEGNLVGAVVGALAGNSTGLHTGNVVGNVNGGVIQGDSELAGDGAIAIPATSKIFYITLSGDPAALTIADPTDGDDDNKVLTIISITAEAHVITDSTSGFNDKGSSGILTFGGAIGDSVQIVAKGGVWYVFSAVNVTPS